MATAREHLTDYHKTAHAHHMEMHKTHAAIAAVHKSMHKATGMTEDQDGPHSQLAEHHAELSDCHKTHAAWHHEAMSACNKAIDSDLNKLVPTAVSGIAPNRPRITPVPRHGQQAIPVNPTPELTKILGLDAEDMDSEERSLQ